MIICVAFVIAVVMMIVAIILQEKNSYVISCSSFSCEWNKSCRCTRKEIAIYDNTIKGLCAYHTENMKMRVIDPMKEMGVIAKNENPIKHSTTLRTYLDTDGRNTIGISHNIRIGKDYYVSGGITTRETSYNNDREVSGQISIVKYW